MLSSQWLFGCQNKKQYIFGLCVVKEKSGKWGVNPALGWVNIALSKGHFSLRVVFFDHPSPPLSIKAGTLEILGIGVGTKAHLISLGLTKEKDKVWASLALQT